MHQSNPHSDPLSDQERWYTDLTSEALANRGIIDEHFDLAFTRQLVEQVVSRLKDVYFRARYIGFENYPKRNNPDRPLIFASNHSGMAFPWDGIILASGVYKMFDYGADSMRPLASPMLSESVLMNPYLFENLWKIVGSVDASFLNFETMLHQNEHNLLIYPEGVPGIGKGFNRRYQLQRFSSSFITLSIKYRTDIVPIFTVNGEYINPYAYKIDVLNKVINRIGVPFLPLGPTTLLLLLQPWVFYMGFPAKLTYVLGRRISPWQMTDKPVDRLPHDELLGIVRRVRLDMQDQLDGAVARYGHEPYRIREFFSVAFGKKNARGAPCVFPWAWPVLFAAFQRQWEKTRGQVESLPLGIWPVIKLFLTKSFYFWFYVPVIGWIPLLIAGVKKVGSTRNFRKVR